MPIENFNLSEELRQIGEREKANLAAVAQIQAREILPVEDLEKIREKSDAILIEVAEITARETGGINESNN